MTSPSRQTARPVAPVVRLVGVLVALWCLGFAVVSAVQLLDGSLGRGRYAAYAGRLTVMAWLVLALKVVGAAVALLAVARRPVLMPTRLVAVLVWGAAALLGLYALGSVVEALGMASGLRGRADQIIPGGVGYVLFFVAGAAGFAVLATSFSRRHATGAGPVVVGAVGAPLVLALLLAGIPALLVTLGVMPG